MKRNVKVEEAIGELYLRFDYVLEESQEKDFIVIVGSIGGDIEQYRVYEDGSVYCK